MRSLERARRERRGPNQAAAGRRSKRASSSRWSPLVRRCSSKTGPGVIDRAALVRAAHRNHQRRQETITDLRDRAGADLTLIVRRRAFRDRRIARSDLFAATAHTSRLVGDLGAEQHRYFREAIQLEL